MRAKIVNAVVTALANTVGAALAFIFGGARGADG